MDRRQSCQVQLYCLVCSKTARPAAKLIGLFLNLCLTEENLFKVAHLKHKVEITSKRPAIAAAAAPSLRVQVETQREAAADDDVLLATLLVCILSMKLRFATSDKILDSRNTLTQGYHLLV